MAVFDKGSPVSLCWESPPTTTTWPRDYPGFSRTKPKKTLNLSMFSKVEGRPFFGTMQLFYTRFKPNAPLLIFSKKEAFREHRMPPCIFLIQCDLPKIKKISKKFPIFSFLRFSETKNLFRILRMISLVFFRSCGTDKSFLSPCGKCPRYFSALFDSSE